VSEWQDVEPCPAPAEVLLACEGELPFAQGKRVLAHLRRCDVCQEQVRAEDAVRGRLSDYLSHQFDADRPVSARRAAFIQLLRAPEHVRAVDRRLAWPGRRMMQAAAILLTTMAGGLALPPAHAESLGAMFTRVAAVVRHTLGFESAGGGTTPQARAIRTADRTPAVPAPAPAPAEPADAEETTARQGAATAAMAAMPDRDALDQAELDARLVLSDASLDLLRGIHVSSNHRAVRVEGIVPSPAPRRRVVARLNQLPYVRVALRAGPVSDGGTPGAGAARVTGLSRWVDYRLGNRPEKQTFVPELTRLAAAVTERVHTLHGLAERYSDDAVKELSPTARGKLQKLLDRHYQSLSADLDALDGRLAVLFGSATRVLPSRRAPGDWQQRVHDGIAHAESLDRSLRELLALDDLPPVPPEDDAPVGERAVPVAFGALWDAVHSGRP
jgi:hypothetical protein